MQCACAVLCCNLWPVSLNQIFPRYLINGTIFRKNKLLNIKHVLIFKTYLIQRIEQGVIYVYSLHERARVILVRIEWNFNILHRVSKKNTNKFVLSYVTTFLSCCYMFRPITLHNQTVSHPDSKYYKIQVTALEVILFLTFRILVPSSLIMECNRSKHVGAM